MNNLRGKAVLITGGTMGIGLATGLAFARQGALCTLTYKWGTANLEEVFSKFQEEDLPRPDIIEADVIHGGDADELLQQVRKHHDHIEAFISNVSFGEVVKDLAGYRLESLLRTIEYSAWPMVEYPRKIKQVFGRYPRYIVGLSSGGPDHFYMNYDFVAASKAVMETLCRYMNYRLSHEDVRINVVRSTVVRTESLRLTCGRDFEEFVERFHKKGQFIPCEEVANAILALCSGLMDGVSGQVLMIDRGTTFFDNLMRLYNERNELKL
jgi:enoyl-[acyl-carrier-protein] reductase (NADH)